MPKQKLKYLNDKVVKKALSSEQKEVRNYIARIISHTTGIPLEELKNNLVPIHPEIASNSHIVNSIADVPFFDQKRYFGIEINYSRSTTSLLKSITYMFQLTLRQVTNSSKYREIKPVTVININAKDFFEKNKFVYKISLREEELNELYSDLFRIYDINLSYFKNIDYNKLKEESLLKDLALFVVEDDKTFNKLYEKDSEIKMIRKTLDNYTKEFDEMFFCSDEELDKQITEEYKEEILKQKSIDIAKNLLALGKITSEEISMTTGLSREEIEKLKLNLSKENKKSEEKK